MLLVGLLLDCLLLVACLVLDDNLLLVGLLLDCLLLVGCHVLQDNLLLVGRRLLLIDWLLLEDGSLLFCRGILLSCLFLLGRLPLVGGLFPDGAGKTIYIVDRLFLGMRLLFAATTLLLSQLFVRHLVLEGRSFFLITGLLLERGLPVVASLFLLAGFPNCDQPVLYEMNRYGYWEIETSRTG